MSASHPTFVIFRDVKDGFWWRLSSAGGETLEHSQKGHHHKGECAQEVFRLKDAYYPYAKVRDAATG
jgi:uncharacterized protein YegP (UPF0339 family)